MDFHGEVAAAIGQRVSIRLRDGDAFRDLLGVLRSENELIKRDGSIATFSTGDIAFFKVVPVFNRRDLGTGHLRIYETSSRELREITAESVRIYSCGPTVYRDAHVGNMRTFLLTDLIVRIFKLCGQEAITVQNITDVGHMADNLNIEQGRNNQGDKVLAEAASQSLTAIEIARKYEMRFHRDLAALNIEPANHYPRASEKMDSIIAAIIRLIESGSAYIGTNGDVYFDARSCKTYGFISGNKLDELQPGYRFEYEAENGKRFHADWSLWKLAKNRSEMIWDSPWGAGFPGWHIECSAMSLELLGDAVDIHVGGIDLRFPHHENERAQTNSIAGKEVVSNWLHGEHLLFEGRKMSKSAGNVVLVEDIVAQGLSPLSLRLVLMENRYRSQMDLTWESLKAADATIERWRSALASWGMGSELKIDQEIFSHFLNDLDTPKALIRLRVIEKDATIGALDKRAIFLYADQVLGLDLALPPKIVEVSKEIQSLIDLRTIARGEGNWAESDRLRDQLASLGYKVQDKKS